MKTIICECCEDIIYGNIFKDYIKTSAGPSTPTIGHTKCGCIFNLIDKKMQKKYSSKIELKSLAMRFAERNGMESEAVGRFLIEVHRLKSSGRLSNNEILIRAFLKVSKPNRQLW